MEPNVVMTRTSLALPGFDRYYAAVSYYLECARRYVTLFGNSSSSCTDYPKA
jgi:hypothetical protein